MSADKCTSGCATAIYARFMRHFFAKVTSLNTVCECIHPIVYGYRYFCRLLKRDKCSTFYGRFSSKRDLCSMNKGVYKAAIGIMAAASTIITGLTLAD